MPLDSISWIPLLLGAYIIGSFPTAYLAGHFLKKADIREMGDKNAGAANVYRNLGHTAGLSVGVIDIAKGALVVLIARVLMDGTAPLMVAGLAGIAGHNWPFYLHFRGGRGAATEPHRAEQGGYQGASSGKRRSTMTKGHGHLLRHDGSDPGDGRPRHMRWCRDR